ncbi:GGDEF domain-containing protein [Deinococcus sedimenti]|uniref:GGDEF domain-containing protein n=1 Tax=Deinococcus sedimenti TaxID=1867090 RepID=A0ABQ2S8Q5_9DEIO|nr:GGDEF domain-containing protein [Deinococcus sedimenti]GGR99780.1 GGDEF domain-containing protein [Deinococcus sedimenti]
MPERIHSEPVPLHDQVGRLYFRVVLPAVAVALMLGGEGRGVVLPILTVMALLGAALHASLPARGRDVLRHVFAACAVAFVLLVSSLNHLPSFQGTAEQVMVAMLLTPATLMAWTLLFADRPLTGYLLNAALTLSVCLLSWRWQVQGVTGGGPTNLPALVLLISVSVTYYAGTFARMNARFQAGERDRLRDPLTGLLNRRALNERPASTGAQHVAVLDIDHFKRVNDTHGHVAGDRVLRAVADVIQDTLAGHGAAYRWGGEEFVLLLPDPCDAAGLVEQVRREIAARQFSGGQRVTLSAGLTRAERGESLQVAFERADAALRAAKSAGRDRLILAPTAAGAAAH